MLEGDGRDGREGAEASVEGVEGEMGEREALRPADGWDIDKWTGWTGGLMS